MKFRTRLSTNRFHQDNLRIIRDKQDKFREDIDYKVQQHGGKLEFVMIRFVEFLVPEWKMRQFRNADCKVIEYMGQEQVQNYLKRKPQDQKLVVNEAA